MSKKVWIVFLAGMMLLLAACGNSVATPAEQPAEVSPLPAEDSSEAVVSEDGQNPVMNCPGGCRINSGRSDGH